MQQSFLSYLVLAIGIILVGGFISALGAHVYATVTAFWFRPLNWAPRAYRREPLHGGVDLGWPTYTASQLEHDFRHQTHVAWLAFRQQRARTARVTNKGAGILLWIFLFPLPALTFLSFLAAYIYMAGMTVVFALAFAAIYAVGGILHWLLVAVVNIADSIWIAAHHAQASCPDCYTVMKRPAVVCRNCGIVHRDIRAGLEGSLFRRCECGQLLPTTVSRASWLVLTCCQVCERPLHSGAGAIRDVRLSFVGATHSGKTRLALATFDDLASRAASAGAGFAYADHQTESETARMRETIRRDEPGWVTPDEFPRALSVREGGVVLGNFIHVFDTAGSLTRTANASDSLTYLSHSHGIVFVVDPFAISTVRSQVERNGHAQLLDLHPSEGQPENLYGAIASRMRASGIATRRQNLAIVVTKADLLERAGVELPSESTAIAEWLTSHSQHNMVIAAAREFGAVQYFAAASRADESDLSPSRATRWLANSRVFNSEQRAKASAIEPEGAPA